LNGRTLPIKFRLEVGVAPPAALTNARWTDVTGTDLFGANVLDIIQGRVDCDGSPLCAGRTVYARVRNSTTNDALGDVTAEFGGDGLQASFAFRVPQTGSPGMIFNASLDDFEIGAVVSSRGVAVIRAPLLSNPRWTDGDGAAVADASPGSTAYATIDCGASAVDACAGLPIAFEFVNNGVGGILGFGSGALPTVAIPGFGFLSRTEAVFPSVGPAAVSLTIGGIALLGMAGVGFVFLSGGRPGWRQALRRGGSLGDALLRAAVAAAGTAGLTRWVAAASSRFPELFEPDPHLPRALERALPGFAGFWSTATSTFTLGVVAATAALAARQPGFRRPLWRVLGGAAVLLALVPTGARSAGEFAATFLPEILLVGWLAFCAFGLLKDHVAAWVLFGVLYFGGMRAAELLSQPAPPDRSAGWTVVVLCVLAAAALLIGRREDGTLAPPGIEPPPPLPAPSDVP